MVEPRERVFAKRGIDMNLADLERIPRTRHVDAEQLFHRAGGGRGSYDVARGSRAKVFEPQRATRAGKGFSCPAPLRSPAGDPAAVLGGVRCRRRTGGVMPARSPARSSQAS